MSNKSTKSGVKMGATPQELAEHYHCTLADVQAAIDARKLTPLMDGSYPAKFPPIGLTQSQMADLRGVSREAVSKAAKKGWLVQLFDGSYDGEASMARWNEHAKARPDSGRNAAPEENEPPTSDGDAGGYDPARARVETAKAEIMELKLAQMKGELVRTADVELAWFEALRTVRDNMRNLPDGLAGRLTGKDEVREVRNILAEAVDRALADTYSALTYGAPDDEADEYPANNSAPEAQEDNAQ